MKTIEQTAAEIAKDPKLVLQLIEAVLETSGFFEDPTAKKEDMVGTRQVVADATNKIANYLKIVPKNWKSFPNLLTTSN